MAEPLDLETLNCLREEVDWENEMDRREFLRRRCPLFENWRRQLIRNWKRSPDLWSVFRPEEVKRLVADSAKVILFNGGDGRVEVYKRFIMFATQTSYRAADLKVDKLDKLLQRLERIIDLHRGGLTSPLVRRLIFETYAKFDANFFDEETRPEHFHLACKFATYDVVEKFLELGLDPNRLQEETGDSPLHLLTPSTHCDDERTIELLLRNGANPNAANLSGSTPLHKMCEFRSPNYVYLIERFLVICDDVQRTVRLDARDGQGRTPLHLALEHGRQELVKLLLRRGADPNLANDDGSTPLHFICYQYHDDELVRIFFEICDKMQLQVQVNARDKSGKTPLQLAVAKLSPKIADVLLNRGADITNSIFPTSIDTELQIGSSLTWKMRVASGALAVAEHLEARGYHFGRSDVLTIMKLFAKHDLFEKSPSDLEKSLRDDQEFASEAKKAMFVPSLSLYDLIHLGFKEEEKLLTYTDYFVFTGQYYELMIPERHSENCLLHLCEKLSRGFFQRWALDLFRELISYKLPIECCEPILAKLNNHDLCNICLAAAGQAS